MKIISTAFEPNQPIPDKYSYKGGNLSPPLIFAGVPVNTKSMALICHDPDAPVKGGFTHWVIWNIPSSVSGFEENSVPDGSIQGLTDWGKNQWGGPMPPSGTHRYNFYLYALDDELKLPTNTNKALLEMVIDGHVLDSAQLTGLYSA
jgi:hypothetical protein